ncbi:MAG: peptide deformylase [Oscillospiraceae bacterium]|jgi:peptide deformylase|nr:peptide deformylase [Oscillospiraceae bacterium]MBQ8929554.1 peptide deformylase [Oscillospiraceae bacterium]MBR6429849.1 peptide deformylase [Oscillospiraceae bacterium]
MALRNIVKEGDPILTKKCRPVTEFNDRLHQLLDDMRQTLLEADGVGLAAPQVGVLRRVVVVLDINRETENVDEQIIELVNPEIIASSGEQYGTEGCLSVPGIYGFVTRPEEVTVRAQDRFGKTFEVTGTGLTARCFCHELDHLEGHLFKELADKLLTAEELDELMAREAEGEA